jgi:protein O-GlcNAc transferase
VAAPRLYTAGVEDLAVSAEEASKWLEARSPGVADIVARAAAQKDPGDGDAWAVLARVAAAVGELDAAEGYAREAVRLGAGAPDLEAAARLAFPGTLTRAGAWGPAPGDEKFLLIKAWGNGFCSDLDHTLGHLLLAEMTGRTPAVHWGRNSLFGRDPERDAFTEFFEPVSAAGIDDLIGKGYDFWPPKWEERTVREETRQKLAGEWSRLPGIVYLNRPERVLVADYHAGVVTLLPWVRPGHPLHGMTLESATRWLVKKHLRLRPEIEEGIEEFAAARFTQRPVIAAHVRGSDKQKEDPDLMAKIGVYPRAIQQLAAGAWFWSLFLLTDWEPAREQFARMFPANLITTECTRTQTQTGLHYQGLPDRVRLGVEVVRDAWLAARCDFFVGMGSSNVSCLIYHLKEWGPGKTVMVGPMMTAMANPYLYMNHDQLARYLPAEMVERLRKLE